MTDFIEARLEEVPTPRGDSVMTLADVIGKSGSDEIDAAGEIVILTTGDTGRGGDSPQEDVSNAMAGEYDAARPAHSPALLYHLGDVIYGHRKDLLYRDQFYVPYRHFPGKIVAIPGNHDGETYPSSDPKTLRAFKENFCAPAQAVPPIAGTIFRQTMNQPGVYWRLDAPFVQVVGLYSNAAENPGFISGHEAGDRQKKWLVKTLKDVKADRDAGVRRALVFAAHHPPISSAGHSGSKEMLADIDDACAKSGIWPDAFLAAHSHTYQRYTRFVPVGGQTWETPYLVVGCGGHAAQPVPPATGARTGDHAFLASFHGFGYCRMTVNARRMRFELVGLSGTSASVKDRVEIDLDTHRVV